MDLHNSNDLFTLSAGDTVTKRNLYHLIQYSKVEGSSYWSGSDRQIRNTPQQGINWIGDPPNCLGVVIKATPGAYKQDGWSDEAKTSYHYSFKAKAGEISYSEKPNRVLVNQPQYLYPILLFTEEGDSWVFEGTFSVTAIEKLHVVLARGASDPVECHASQDELLYEEGGRHYVTHLMAERNQGVVKAVKHISPWSCDICALGFSTRYGVDYIEAHHKVPISTYSSSYVVNISDFVLLCPNCHKAVHIYMKQENLNYEQIKTQLTLK